VLLISRTARTFQCFRNSPRRETAGHNSCHQHESALPGSDRHMPLDHLNRRAWFVVVIRVIVFDIWRNPLAVADFIFRAHAGILADLDFTRGHVVSPPRRYPSEQNGKLSTESSG